MHKTPSISDAEWRVMAAIWERGPCTAGDVVQALARRREWHPRTVKTMLGRLLRKGVLGHRTEGNRYVYWAKISRDACLRRETRSFLERLFEGDAVSALVHLAKAGNLTEPQLEKLREILRQETKR